MLQSYEAIYEHGRLTWTADAPNPVRARVIVTLIDEPFATESLQPRKPLSEDEIEEIMQKTCGAWGKRSLEESDAMIKQRRLEDWGEDTP
ncbi:MAG: hypothetical protein H7836_12680 [Magnetococcus sp. YQC-3]